MNWIQHPLVLEGPKVRLEPLCSDHFDELLELGKAKEIWTYLATDGTDSEALQLELKSAIIRRTAYTEYPFVVIDKLKGKIIGSTRFYNIYPVHRKLEIGWTWYHPDYWGRGYNAACKLLLLTHCFEVLKTTRVQFQVTEHNARSRAAVARIGATCEGVLRKDRMRPDGNSKNTVIYSIIDDEWAAVKAGLEKMIG